MNVFVELLSIPLITYLESEESIPLIRKSLEDPMWDAETKRESQILLSEFIYRKTGAKIEHHRLYCELPEFFKGKAGLLERAELKKTGGRIILPKAFRGKIIQKVLPAKGFELWKKAFEGGEEHPNRFWLKNPDYVPEIWRKNVFDYIPVEPILRRGDKEFWNESQIANLKKSKAWGKLMAFQSKDKKDYFVLTKVLGENLEAFLLSKKNKEFHKKMEDDRVEIVDVLRRLKIDHNHPHYRNFCIKMHNGKLGLYVIDFDEAKIMKRD